MKFFVVVFVISTAFGQTPESPGNLLATPVSSSEIHLRWYGSNRDVDFFEVQVFVSSSSQPVIGTVLPHENFEYRYIHSGLTPNTGVNYRIIAVREMNGTRYQSFSNVAYATTLPATSDVKEVSGTTPESFRLEQNYPNPFNPSTTIRFELLAASHVTLTVWNTLGQRVETLVNDELTAGKHEATWDARNVPSGTYFYKLQTDKFVATKKMILVK